ncbi:MAG: redoxin domain-containing protein [Daejeonella sp.]
MMKITNTVNINNKSLFWIFALLSFFLSPEVFAQNAPAQKVPEFTFYKMNGQAFVRKDISKTKKAVIIFFDVTCDHCQKELKSMSDHFAEFKKAEFYMVSMDNVSGIELFMKRYAPNMNGKPNVTLLTDINRQFIERFLPVQYPALYIYGTDGRLIRYFGQNSKISEIIKTVNQL